VASASLSPTEIFLVQITYAHGAGMFNTWTRKIVK
jgi:hypothetical protein